MGKAAAEIGLSHRERMAKRSRDATASVADIGEIPSVANATRRESCGRDLLAFLQTYFPNSTGLSPFSDDHKRVIARIERCILHGGRFVNAVYRGFAKSTISENAALWALLYGHRKFVAIFGADATAAEGNIDSIKLELAENDLLAADFPEVCHAVQALEGKPQRCASQTCNGALTHIEWTADKVVLPTVPGSAASGSVIVTRGIEGGSRGLKHKTPQGRNLRPDLIILDDPQTDESAGSAHQVKKRLAVLRKNLLKLAGHQTGLAIVVNATVIQQDDMVDQLLNPKLNPSWQGERIPLVREWSTAHETLWKEYERLRNDYDPDRVGAQEEAHAKATEFYLANRDAMDAGCKVSWEHCFNHELEVSAIQHAYNSLIDDGPEAFASEMQQQPLREESSAMVELTAGQIASKLSRIPQAIAPVECPTLVGYVDVQQEALFWVVSAWGGGFVGSVIDYGVFPDQSKNDFTLKGIRRKLSDLFPGMGLEPRLYAGLTQLVNTLAGKEWPRFGGGGVRLRRLLIDEGFETGVIFQFCRQSPHAAVVLPAKGIGIGAKRAPMREWAKRDGEVRGHHFRISRGNVDRGISHAVIDTNFWKSFVHARLATPLGAPGCLTLYGDDPRRHDLFASHVLGEFRTQVSADGRTVDEWSAYPDARDQHWFDGLVGSAAAAAMEGVKLTEWENQTTQRKRVEIPGHMRAK